MNFCHLVPVLAVSNYWYRSRFDRIRVKCGLPLFVWESAGL